jgi:hypothetical protein
LLDTVAERGRPGEQADRDLWMARVPVDDYAIMNAVCYAIAANRR